MVKNQIKKLPNRKPLKKDQSNRSYNDKDRWKDFPVSVFMIEDGTYPGRISYVDYDKETETLTVDVESKEIDFVSKKYEVEYRIRAKRQLKPNTPLYFFLNAMGAIGTGGKIDWDALRNRNVDVVVTNGSGGTYIKSIKPQSSDDGDAPDEYGDADDEEFDEEDEGFDEEDEE